MSRATRKSSPSLACRPGYIREVSLVYKWARVPEWLDTTQAVTSSRKAWPYFRPLEQRVRETLMVLYLNQCRLPLAREVVSVGALTYALASAGEILRSALHVGAAGVIVAHNHPSGSSTPSPDDEIFFDRLKEAGDLVGVSVPDSLIIVPGSYFSLADSRSLKQAMAFYRERRGGSSRRSVRPQPPRQRGRGPAHPKEAGPRSRQLQKEDAER